MRFSGDKAQDSGKKDTGKQPVSFLFMAIECLRSMYSIVPEPVIEDV